MNYATCSGTILYKTVGFGDGKYQFYNVFSMFGHGIKKKKEKEKKKKKSRFISFHMVYEMKLISSLFHASHLYIN